MYKTIKFIISERITVFMTEIPRENSTTTSRNGMLSVYDGKMLIGEVELQPALYDLAYDTVLFPNTKSGQKSTRNRFNNAFIKVIENNVKKTALPDECWEKIKVVIQKPYGRKTYSIDLVYEIIENRGVMDAAAEATLGKHREFFERKIKCHPSDTIAYYRQLKDNADTNAYAALELGHVYFRGTEFKTGYNHFKVEKDYEKAWTNYKKACVTGKSGESVYPDEASYSIGSMILTDSKYISEISYITSKNVLRERAKEWFDKSYTYLPSCAKQAETEKEKAEEALAKEAGDSIAEACNHYVKYILFLGNCAYNGWVYAFNKLAEFMNEIKGWSDETLKETFMKNCPSMGVDIEKEEDLVRKRFEYLCMGASLGHPWAYSELASDFYLNRDDKKYTAIVSDGCETGKMDFIKGCKAALDKDLRFDVVFDETQLLKMGEVLLEETIDFCDYLRAWYIKGLYYCEAGSKERGEALTRIKNADDKQMNASAKKHRDEWLKNLQK